MPEYTPRLNLPKPLGNENVTRAAHIALVDAIDAAAAKKGFIGDNNSEVAQVKAALLETDTRSQALTYTSGQLTKVEEKAGATVVKTTTLTYNATSGKLEKVTEVAGGTTVESTLIYDGNGILTGTTKAVV